MIHLWCECRMIVPAEAHIHWIELNWLPSR